MVEVKSQGPIGCSRCETVPGGASESGTLYLSPPLGHTRATVTSLLRGAGLDVQEVSPGILSLTLVPGRLEILNQAISKRLSLQELQDTPSLVLGPDQTLGIDTVFQAQPLRTLLARVRSEWLLDILRERRLTIAFQPIVSAADPTALFGYECLSRGVDGDGAAVGGGELYAASEDANVLFQLDLASRIAAIEAAGTHGLSSSIFINFNPASVYDPANCLRSTVRAIKDSALSPEQIVFEVVESTDVPDPDHLFNILTFYRDAGFRVALDDLGAGFSSLNMMARLRPDFIKLDMALVRDVDSDPFRATMVRKLLEAARELGVRTVAEGVETEAEWSWLKANGAYLIQGYLIAAPATPPPAPSEQARQLVVAG